MNSKSISKHYISASKLLNDSYELALQILDSDFHPDFIVGVWRGGTPVGIAVQELLSYCGIDSDHIAIRTSLYTGIDQQASYVRVHGLDYLVNNVNAEDGLLIVDDVFDSGRSVNQIILELHKKCRKNTPKIKVATPYFKPSKNKTQRIPDFYLHETEDWLVFPHELEGLSIDEILENKPEIESIKDRLIHSIKNL
ncbi:phosphoribosyltransferase family protein [Porticoccus sp. W117]|uniref:phosphoribosyltransferase n=1 Tax=Porticoccus sp. W117 TaxID=3054777 RepID=UPI00259533AE|nr:phosphoribosyltransferase family protein [Porticoccus sp. W117]MDM3872345.1 phosphoribosyltransferase family protein [Porticoccus sp. W117]